jgi:ferredoxin-like protein FixX
MNQQIDLERYKKQNDDIKEILNKEQEQKLSQMIYERPNGLYEEKHEQELPFTGNKCTCYICNTWSVYDSTGKQIRSDKCGCWRKAN